MITLSQSQFDSIPTLSDQKAVPGLVIKKTDGESWYRLTYGSSDEKGNFEINVEEILVQGEIKITDPKASLADIYKQLASLTARVQTLEAATNSVK